MPTTLDLLKRRASRPVSLADDDMVSSLRQRRGKSAWEAILDYLDLPGLSVRSLIKGDIGGVARSVGSFALPGIIDQPEDRHDFGFLGNLATDPLLWFTGGGAGLRGALASATKGVVGKAATKGAASAIRRSLTKAGRKEFAGIAAKTTGRTAARAEEAAFLKAARNVQRLPSAVDDLLAKGLADRGGLKFGLPFMEGRTVARAGKPASLAMASPFYWGAKAAGKGLLAHSKTARNLHEYVRGLGQKLYPGFGMNETGRGIAAARDAQIRRLQGEYADEIVQTFKGFDREALEDFHQTLTGRDLRGSGVTDPDSFKAVHPKVAYDDALGRYRKFMDRMKQDLVERGIWSPDVPEAVVQKRLAHLYPDEAQALKKFNEKGAKEAAERGEEFVPAKIGDDVEIPVYRRDVLHTAKGRDEARAWASAFKRDNPGVKGVTVRRVKGAGVQPWQVTVRSAQEEMRSLKGLTLPENLAYAPQQLSDEALERVEKLNYDAMAANTEDVFPIRGTGASGASPSNVFQGERKFAQEDFLDFGEDVTGLARKGVQSQDVAELAMKRATAHARSVSNFDMLAKAKKVYGKDRLLGAFDDEVDALNALDEAREAGVRNAKVVERTVDGRKSWRVVEPGSIAARDRAFAEWIAAGAGRVSQRKGVLKSVDWWNKNLFKPLVTVGAGPIPNPPFLIRNAVSGVIQAAAHPQIGLASGLRHVAQIAYDGIAALVEKIPGMGKLPRSQLTRILRGDVTDALVEGTKYTEKEIAALIRKHGVAQSFVRMEDLLDALAPVRKVGGGKGAAKKVYDAVLGSRFPARLSDAIESRMRAQGFVHALRKSLDPADAAKATREAFIDYGMVSDLHRNIRDIIPFAQFTIGQTPRTIRTALERPRVLSPLVASSRRDDEGIVPPWVAEQPHFKLGKDVEGKSAFLAGLGTPFEDINAFWTGGLGRTLEKEGAGRLAPPLKFLYEQATGRDPFFGRPISDYRRETPTTALLPDWLAGRTVRTTKEGGKIPEVSAELHRVLQKLPWSRQIGMANQLFDSRKRTWHKAVSLLTGAKVVSVDEDRELRKLILDYLREKAEGGDIGEFSRFFAYGETSPELAALIKAVHAKR